MLLRSHFAKDGGMTGRVGTSTGMMLILTQQRADQGLTQAMELRRKEGGAAGWCSCPESGVITDGPKVWERTLKEQCHYIQILGGQGQSMGLFFSSLFFFLPQRLTM